MKQYMLLALLIFGTPAVMHAGQGKPPCFEELDANSDGRLSKEEVTKDPFLSREFAKLDKNGDGYLTKDELPAPPQGGPGHSPGGEMKGEQGGPGGHRPPSFEELDTNKDGYISKEEAAKDPRLMQMFDKFDANHDGQLSKDELPAPPQGGPKAPAQQ